MSWVSINFFLKQTYTVVKCELLLKYAKKIQQSGQYDFFEDY